MCTHTHTHVKFLVAPKSELLFVVGLLESDGVDLDEAGGVRRLVVALDVHADERLVVQRVVDGLARSHVHVALEDGHGDRARHVLLALGHHVTHELGLGRVPEAVVDDLGVARHQRLLDLAHLAVHGERLDVEVSVVEDGAAGRLVDAARLHAHEAVLDDVDATHAVRRADAVQIDENLERVAHFLARLGVTHATLFEK